MNTVLWIFQIFAGMLFTRHGMGMIQLPDRFKERIPWVLDLSPGLRKFIGSAEILGGVGMILPGLFGFYTFLTPLAAAGLAFTMVGAVVFHIRRNETKGLQLNVILMLITTVIAYYRWAVLPL